MCVISLFALASCAKGDGDLDYGIEKVYINGIKVLDGDMLDAEAIMHSGRAIRNLNASKRS